MSIEAGTTYEALTFGHGDTMVWTIQGPLFGDTVAGIMTGLVTLMEEMIINGATDDTNHVEFLYRTEIEPTPGRKERVLRSVTYSFIDAMDVGLSLHSYIVASNTTSDRFPEYHHLLNQRYGWWIIDPLYDRTYWEKKYTLFAFDSPQFIQGFISICRGFGVDFRDYIVGTPFKYDRNQREIINYEIEGYDVEPFTVEPKRVPQEGPYYTNEYEADAHAVNFE